MELIDESKAVPAHPGPIAIIELRHRYTGETSLPVYALTLLVSLALVATMAPAPEVAAEPILLEILPKPARTAGAGNK